MLRHSLKVLLRDNLVKSENGVHTPLSFVPGSLNKNKGNDLPWDIVAQSRSGGQPPNTASSTCSPHVSLWSSVDVIAQIICAGLGKASGYSSEAYPNGHIWPVIPGCYKVRLSQECQA